MKIKLLVITSSSVACAEFHMHTGGVSAPVVQRYEREIEIPDPPEDMGIEAIHILRKETADHPGGKEG